MYVYTYRGREREKEKEKRMSSRQTQFGTGCALSRSNTRWAGKGAFKGIYVCICT